MTGIGGQDRSLILKTLCACVVLCVAGLCAGTFFDLQISQTLYQPTNPFAIFFSVVGLLPLTIPACILLGALAQRQMVGSKPVALRVLLAVVCVAFACVIAYLAVKSLPTIGGPESSILLPGIALVAISLVLGLGCVAVGFACARNNDEADLVRRALLAFVLLILSYALIELGKGIMHRPRYYAVATGIEGISFQPWYKPFTGYKELIEKGVANEVFKSFPSGHAAQIGTFVTGFYGLTVLIPSLRNKWRVAVVVGLVLVLAVCVSRMILGAHYLSDVSVGVLISTLVAFAIPSRAKE
ncbi:MAG: phosphatase PAP2 family protein [Coriobacteriales bacterium]|nr:phosphatase PAP2 family protein [Coriobacteriales bacterium]